MIYRELVRLYEAEAVLEAARSDLETLYLKTCIIAGTLEEAECEAKTWIREEIIRRPVAVTLYTAKTFSIAILIVRPISGIGEYSYVQWNPTPAP